MAPLLIFLKFKQKITGQAGKIMVPLKCLSNFWGTLKMLLINWTNNFLTWSANCFLMAGAIDNKEPTFRITDMKLFVPSYFHQLMIMEDY